MTREISHCCPGGVLLLCHCCDVNHVQRYVRMLLLLFFLLLLLTTWSQARRRQKQPRAAGPYSTFTFTSHYGMTHLCDRSAAYLAVKQKEPKCRSQSADVSAKLWATHPVSVTRSLPNTGPQSHQHKSQPLVDAIHKQGSTQEHSQSPHTSVACALQPLPRAAAAAAV